MPRNPASHAFREIRTLFTQGAVGGLTDAQLVERFLDRANPGREDAFAALVQRHGPMVWRVCRRMLSGSADTDDAFQAVFLVLARKAGSIRRADGLKSWLYGVSVRTAKEARRRAARRAAREGGTMDLSRPVTTPSDDHADLLALLDEEIDRLPSRFRDVILLCDLDGVSRHDAASQLHLPEGTISSRLNRGRTLLRDRLTRRGVSLGTTVVAALISETTSASFPDRLADSTAHLALHFTTGGTVPAAVQSLAEGVIWMSSSTKLTLLAGALIVLTATVGLTLVGNQKPDQKTEQKTVDTPPPVTFSGVIARVEKTPDPGPNQIRGFVYQNNWPAARAEVRAAPFTEHETRAVTDPGGMFTIAAPTAQVDGTRMIAYAEHGDQVGAILYQVGPNQTIADTPARIVLQPAQAVTVRVVDANKAPIAGASVEVVESNAPVAAATTGANGSARLLVPSRAKVCQIVAMKPGRGLDYAEFGPVGMMGQPGGGVSADALPDVVTLVLNGGRTARIKAVDRKGKPLGGIRFAPGMISKAGRRGSLWYTSGMLAATTGPDGIATFDWLPPWKTTRPFHPTNEEYAHHPVAVKEGETGVVTTTLIRNEAIRGRVVYADGSPAPGIMVRARGSGRESLYGYGHSTTGGDGTFEIRIPAEQVYAVSVQDRDWTAPTHFDVIVREGQPATGVDFTLSPGTIVRGIVTTGPDNHPAPGQVLPLVEHGGPRPDEFRQPGSPPTHEIERQEGIHTDPFGRYSIRLGPGTYTVLGLLGLDMTAIDTIVVKDEREIVHDISLPQPSKKPSTVK